MTPFSQVKIFNFVSINTRFCGCKFFYGPNIVVYSETETYFCGCTKVGMFWVYRRRLANLKTSFYAFEDSFV